MSNLTDKYFDQIIIYRKHRLKIGSIQNGEYIPKGREGKVVVIDRSERRLVNGKTYKLTFSIEEHNNIAIAVINSYKMISNMEASQEFIFEKSFMLLGSVKHGKYLANDNTGKLVMLDRDIKLHVGEQYNMDFKIIEFNTFCVAKPITITHEGNTVYPEGFVGNG